jgi:hypothetical protein
MPQKLLSVGTLKKCRTAGTLSYSKSSLLTTSSTTHPSQTQRLIKTAYGIYIVGFVLHSPIFTQISIGRPAMAKWLRLTKRIVERTIAPFLGIAPTHRKIHFESVDVMRVQNGKINEHWGVANLFSLMQQLGALKT